MKTPTAVRLVATCLGLFVLLPDAGARLAAASSSSQSAALARLLWGILSCETHPCGEDSTPRIHSLLEDRIVSEGTYQYSDLALTFPDAGRHLKGIVEWDLGSSVDGISLIVVDFGDSREALKSELEAGLPGCVIDSEPADDCDATVIELDAPAAGDAPAPGSAATDAPAPGSAATDAPVPGSAATAGTGQEDWDCDIDRPGHKPAGITIHVARETLMIEIF